MPRLLPDGDAGLSRISDIGVRALSSVIRGYQAVSAPWPRVCRFYPSCSHYALEALSIHGVLSGSWLTARRLLRCHPFHPGGIDFVPSRPVYAPEQGTPIRV